MFRKIFGKLNHKYRIQFIDHESLRQSKPWVIRPVVLLILSSLVTLLIIGGTAALIVLTPVIRENIPGYTNPQLERDFAIQQEKVQELMSTIEQRDCVLVSLRRIYGSDRPGGVTEVNFDEVMAEVNAAGFEMPHDPVNESDHNQNVRPKPIVNSGAGRPERGMSQVLNLVSPVQGRIGTISKRFKPDDKKEKHFGVDIVANENAEILAVADGYVIFSEYSNQTGYVLGISHKNGLISFYKHNSRLYKKVGSYVFAGEAVAVIGNTGENTTGQHLHFELWKDGRPVDPEEYIILR